MNKVAELMLKNEEIYDCLKYLATHLTLSTFHDHANKLFDQFNLISENFYDLNESIYNQNNAHDN